MSADNTVAEFQRRRRLWLQRARPPLVLSFLFFFAFFGMIATRHTDYVPLALGLAIACLAVAGYFTWRLFRCPGCNAVLGARRTARGFEDDPEICIHCGARLRAVR